MSHWPQWLYLVLMFIGIICVAYSHGKPRKENIFVHLIAVAIVMTILIFGGFFRGMLTP